MSLKHPSPGPGFVPEYQVSGIPFVTSSAGLELTSLTVPTKIKFPSATRWIQVIPHGNGTLNLGFSGKGVLGEGASVSGSQGITPGVPGHEAVADHNNFIVVSGSAANAVGATALSHDGTLRLELRCKEIFMIRSAASGPMGFSIVAGLTGIPSSNFPTLTGSVGFLGIG